jgi:hypothetical protein
MADSPSWPLVRSLTLLTPVNTTGVPISGVDYSNLESLTLAGTYHPDLALEFSDPACLPRLRRLDLSYCHQDDEFAIRLASSRLCSQLDEMVGMGHSLLSHLPSIDAVSLMCEATPDIIELLESRAGPRLRKLTLLIPEAATSQLLECLVASRRLTLQIRDLTLMMDLKNTALDCLEHADFPELERFAIKASSVSQQGIRSLERSALSRRLVSLDLSGSPFV